MEKSFSPTARILAAVSLIAAVLILVVVAATALNGGSGSEPHRKEHQVKKERPRHRTEAKTYTVKTGDTLISIAHETGVPVAELLALNPEVDPQILIAGQTLKLR